MKRHFQKRVKVSNTLESDYSYYYNVKERLSLYDIENSIPAFEQIKKEMFKNKKLQKSINYKIKRKSFINHKSEYLVDKAEHLLRRRIELDKIKKYKKSALNAELCSTVASSVSSDNVYLFRHMEDNTKLQFTLFIEHRDKFAKENAEIVNYLSTCDLSKHFFSMDEFFLQHVNELTKIDILEYHMMTRTLKEKIGDCFLSPESLSHFIKALHYFNEFFYLLRSVCLGLGIHVYKYYTGQPENQILFNRIMFRMLWYLIFVIKRKKVLLEDILFFLDIGTINAEIIKDIKNNLRTYLEYSKKFFFFTDVLSVLTIKIIKERLEDSIKEDMLISAEEIKDIVRREVLKYLQTKSI